MNSPLPHDELQTLLAKLVDGHLLPEEHARLENLLREDKNARRVYRDHMLIHSMLYWQHTDVPRPALVDSPQEKATSRDPSSPLLGFLGNTFRQGYGFFSNHAPLLGILLVVALLGGVIGLAMFRGGVAGSTTSRIAHLSQTHACQWGGLDTPLITGSSLLPGQRLNLVEGLAEIAFSSGTRVVLQGPAVFDLESENGGFLRSGTLTARVAAEHKNFTIHMPSVEVVDLGTEFGAAVIDERTAEAHVFSGHIEVRLFDRQGNAGRMLELHEGQAVRIDTLSGQVANRPTDPGRFGRTLAAERLLGCNLVDNGDFEARWYEPKSNARRIPNIDIPGWIDRGPATTLAYDASAGGLSKRHDGPENRGRYYLIGMEACTLTQELNLTPLTARIDDEKIRFAMAAWLGGGRNQNDGVIFLARFYDAGGTEIGECGLGPVTAAHRQGKTQLLHRHATGPIPPGTRWIRLELEIVHDSGQGKNPTADAYADNLSFLLTEGEN